MKFSIEVRKADVDAVNVYLTPEGGPEEYIGTLLAPQNTEEMINVYGPSDDNGTCEFSVSAPTASAAVGALIHLALRHWEPEYVAAFEEEAQFRDLVSMMEVRA